MNNWEWIDVEKKIVCLSFKRVLNHFAFATQTNVYIYRIEPFGLVYKEDLPDVQHIDLISQDQVGVVMNNILHIYDLHSRKMIADFLIPTYRLVGIMFVPVPNLLSLICETSTQIYQYNKFNKPIVESEDIEINYNFEHKRTLITGENMEGVCGVCDYYSMICVPDSAETGSIQIFKYDENKILRIRAHDNPVRCLCFSDNGKVLITAAQRGKILRVWDVATGKLRKEVKRGTFRSLITSISISYDNEFFACYGTGGTMHVFRLKDTSRTYTEKVVTGERSILKCTMTDELSRAGGEGIVTFSRNLNFIIYFLNVESSIFYQVMADYVNNQDKKFRKGYVIDSSNVTNREFLENEYGDVEQEKDIGKSLNTLWDLSKRLERKVYKLVSETFNFEQFIGMIVKDLCREHRIKETSFDSNQALFLSLEKEDWKEECEVCCEFVVMEVMKSLSPLLSDNLLPFIQSEVVSQESVDKMAVDLVQEMVKRRLDQVKKEVKPDVRRIILGRLKHLRRRSRSSLKKQHRRMRGIHNPKVPITPASPESAKRTLLTNQMLLLTQTVEEEGEESEDSYVDSSEGSDDESDGQAAAQQDEEVKKKDEEEAVKNTSVEKIERSKNQVGNMSGYLRFLESVRNLRDEEEKIGLVLKPQNKKHVSEKMEPIPENLPYLMIITQLSTTGTLLKFQVSRSLSKTVDDWDRVELVIPESNEKISGGEVIVKSTSKIGEFQEYKSRDGVLYLTYIFKEFTAKN